MIQGVEIAHLNAALTAGLRAYYDFRHSTVEDALRPIGRYGKKDTLGMDAGPEITICEALGRYDHGAVVITEEVGSKGMIVNDSFRPNDPQSFRTVFISDPTDRSNQLKKFLTGFSRNKLIGEIIGTPGALAQWEKKFGNPASISGANSAISCIRRGKPIFAVIINYITSQLFVSCAAGNRMLTLPEKHMDGIDFSYVQNNGEIISFPGISNEPKSMRRFVTFLGDTGKIGYKENFTDSGLMNVKDAKTFLHYGVPGGPTRALYLSALQSRDKPVGFVLANGEKIGEWVHWLSFVRFAKSRNDESQPALHLYEVFQDRPWTKEGVLMSTPPNYSVFREYDEQMYVDTSWLLRMPNPSQLRATLIVGPHDNRWAMRTGSQSRYRRIQF